MNLFEKVPILLSRNYLPFFQSSKWPLLNNPPYLSSWIRCSTTIVKDTDHPFQHGFMAGRSFNTNLVDFTSFIAMELDKQDIKQVDEFYNYLSSAFWCSFSSSKQSFPDIFFYGSRAFLATEHNICLLVTENHSFFIPTGVPHKGHCRPTLYNLIANFIATQIKGIKASFYADDFKLAKTLSSVADCVRLQQGFNYFTGNSLGLKLTERKCKTMTFTRSRTHLLFNYEVNGGVPIGYTSLMRLVLSFTVELIKHLSPTFKSTKTLMTLFNSLGAKPFLTNSLRPK